MDLPLAHAIRERAASMSRALADLRRHDSAFWRKAAAAGVEHGPEAFLKYSPPVFGLAFWAALPKVRARVRHNLRLARGERSAIEDARDAAEVFMNFASSLTDAFAVGQGRKHLIGMGYYDDHHFQGALTAKKGVIAATAHTAGWELSGVVLQARHAADVVIVMNRERDARAQQIQDEARDRAGARVVHVGDSALDALPLLTHLRRGGVVALQIDRMPPGMRGRDVTLFSEPWRVPEGPLMLAALSGSPIVPTFTRRLGYLAYEVRSFPPIFVPRRPTADDLDRGARALAGAMEAFVREHPTQWFHFV